MLRLLPLVAMFSTLYFFAPGMFVRERTGRVALLNVTGAMVNLVAALALTRWCGLLGAALAATIAPGFVFAGYLALGRTWFRVALMLVLVSIGMGLLADSAFCGPATLAIRAALWCICFALAMRFGTEVADRHYSSQALQGLTRPSSIRRYSCGH